MFKFVDTSGPDQQGSILADPTLNNDQIKGNPNAKVALVEYSDFECPACAMYYPIIKQLNEEFGNDMKFIYRHFPLAQHKNAESTAYVAEAAGIQDKFWEMHDLIFENQDEWSVSDNSEDLFIAYAESIGLNIDKFNVDKNSEEVKTKVAEDYESGVRSKINATPTFYLNNKKVAGVTNYEGFQELIKQAIKESLE